MELILTAIVIGAMIPILAKEYNVTHNYICLIIAIIFSFIFLYMYIVIFKNNSFGTTYSIISILSLLLVIVIGFFHFHEKLTKLQIIGVLFGIASIYMLSK